MEDHGECMLVLIGATPEGKKELIGFQVGVRESAQSRRELLIDVKQRDLQIAPEIAVGDGALGFWKALDEIFPGTRHRRCWVHKTVNVLDEVPLSVQATMKKDLREIYWAPNRASAEIDVVAEKYRAKYGRAVECLVKDRDALLAFYDFPAEHWDHLRTTDEMDKRFFSDRDDDCGDHCKSILLFGRAAGHSSVPAIDLAAAPSTAADWRGTGLHSWRGWNLPSAAIMVVGRGRPPGKRDASAASVTGRPILSCRAEAPARRFLAAAVSTAPQIVRSFAPPGRQSTSRGRAAP